MTPITFISCAIEPWHTPWLARQHLMSQIAAQGSNVLYVLKEPSFDEAVHSFGRGLGIGGASRPVGTRIYEVHPSRMFPRFYFSQPINHLSGRLRARALMRLMRSLKWSRPLLYIWNPHYSDYLELMPRVPSIFHCHDFYPHFFPEGSAQRADVLRRFHSCIDRAGAVVACSEALYEYISARRRHNVHLIENGVDYKLFAKPVEVPPEFQKVRRPLIGYIGRINRKVNLDALMAAARARKDWTILLMGPRTGWDRSCEDKFQEFLRLPNALYLEGKDPSLLPPYVHSLDVGLMNYNQEGTWVNYGFPLKLFEYFSAGKPVVATELPSIRKFSGLLEFVGEGGDWSASIEKVLAEETAERRARRKALAEGNSWERRAQDVLQIAEGLYEKSGLAAGAAL